MKTVIIDGVEMTFEQAFRMMWKEISENEGMGKDDFFKKHEVNKDIECGCFACEASNDDFRYNCGECPVKKWRNIVNATYYYCPCIDYVDENKDIISGLYGKWGFEINSSNYKQACSIAKQISELEWEEV